MPMFPLGTVLLPHQMIPLHVFEPRYRQLMRDALAGDRTFGIVLIERGSEVGGGDARFDVGTAATIVDAEELPDGRWTLHAIGGDRLRVLGWLADEPYPQADVQLVADEGWTDADEAAFTATLAAFARVLDLAEQLGATVDRRVLDLPGERLWDHWVLADRAPLGDLDRLAVLAADAPVDRLRLLGAQLDDLAEVLASRLSGG